MDIESDLRYRGNGEAVDSICEVIRRLPGDMAAIALDVLFLDATGCNAFAESVVVSPLALNQRSELPSMDIVVLARLPADPAQAQAVIAHEIAHCALRHSWERKAGSATEYQRNEAEADALARSWGFDCDGESQFID